MDTGLKRVWRRIVGCFVAGVLAILPVVVTVAIVGWVVSFLQRYMGPGTVVGRLLSGIGFKISPDTVPPYLIGWIVVLGVVFAVGVAVEFGAKRMLQRGVDALFKRIPLVGNIYSTSRQVVEMMDKKDEAALQGMSAVFCFFGKDAGTGVLAFLVSPERFRLNDREYHIVIIPTAPIPFGGAMLFIPAEQVKPADMSVDGLMSIYLSMGVAATDYLPREVEK